MRISVKMICLFSEYYHLAASQMSVCLVMKPKGRAASNQTSNAHI